MKDKYRCNNCRSRFLGNNRKKCGFCGSLNITNTSDAIRKSWETRKNKQFIKNIKQFNNDRLQTISPKVKVPKMPKSLLQKIKDFLKIPKVERYKQHWRKQL